MSTRRRHQGVTMVELVVGMTLFAILAVVLASAMKEGGTIWRLASGGSAVGGQLRSARMGLSQDLERTAFSKIYTTQVPGSLGGGYDGDAIWFLSSWDPKTGQYRCKQDGTPWWQSNILYYLIVPKGYASLYGDTCHGDKDKNGYDDECPYKFLIRKVIYTPPVADPTDNIYEESLIQQSSISTYLTRPDKFDVSAMSKESDVTSVRIQAHNLLYFHVQLAPPPDYVHEVLVDLRATDAVSARRQLDLGNVPLGTSRFTTQQLFGIFPSLP